MNTFDDFFQLMPFGDYPVPSQGLVQVFDRKAMQDICRNFEDHQKARGVLIDFDHFSVDPTKPSVAAGWLQDMEIRPDGLWGKARWTSAGADAVANSLYRYTSVVFSREDMEELGGRRVRPRQLHSVGLTNAPNIRTLQPLTNRRQELIVNHDQVARAVEIKNRALAIAKAQRRGFAAAWAQAQRDDATFCYTLKY
jgi:phage I-like protein